MTAGKPKRVILHIGSDKAGSKAIQTHILGNRDWLSQRGILVSERYMERNGQHESLFRLAVDERRRVLAEELERASTQSKQLLYSWEGLHQMSNAEVQQLAGCFDGAEVRIIYYVREQAELLQSSVMQQIRQGTQNFNFQKWMESPRCPPGRNYLAVVERWEQAFGNARMEVVLYDRDCFAGGSVVTDFFGRVAGDCSGLRRVDSDINPSLDVRSALALTLLDDAPETDPARRREIVDILMRLIVAEGPGSEYFLGARQVEAIRGHYAEGNRVLVEKYGVDARLLTPRQDIVKSEEVTPAQAKAQLERAYAIMNAAGYVPIADGFMRSGSTLSPFLVAGWHLADDGEVWLAGGRATIRMRRPLGVGNPFLSEVRIRLRGSYRSEVWRKTEVILNGMPKGTMNLSSADITHPIEQLAGDGIVELELLHADAALPTGGSRPEREGEGVFALRALGLAWR